MQNHDFDRMPYLFHALLSGNQPTINLVIKYGASLTEKGIISGDQTGHLLMANALGFAVQLGNEKVLANLLKHMKNSLEEKTSEQEGLKIVENAEKSTNVG